MVKAVDQTKVPWWVSNVIIPLTNLTLAFIVSGAIGNLIDRLNYKAVVDFIDIGAGGFRWYTFNIADSLETTDGNISFTYNEEDYLIDVSSCIEIESEKITRLIQDTKLKVVYVFEEHGGYPFNYSSPNELLYVK